MSTHMPNTIFNVVGFAAINEDLIIFSEDKVPDVEVRLTERISVNKYDYRVLGGSVVNTLTGLAKLGFKVGIIGKVGSDEVSNWLIQELRSRGIEFIGFKSIGYSGRTIIKIDKFGNRFIQVLPSVNDDITIDEILKIIHVIKRSKLIHSSTFACITSINSLKTQAYLYENLEIEKSLTFGMLYSTLYRNSTIHRELINKILENTNILFINRDELKYLCSGTLIDCVDYLLTKFNKIKIVCLTMGKEGVYVKSRNGVKIRLESFCKEIVDSTGAGDAFVAGFLAGYLLGKDLYTCTKWGISMSCEALKCIGGSTYEVPDEILKEIKS